MLTTAGSTLATTPATSSDVPANCDERGAESGSGDLAPVGWSRARVSSAPVEPATSATARSAVPRTAGRPRRRRGGEIPTHTCSGTGCSAGQDVVASLVSQGAAMAVASATLLSLPLVIPGHLLWALM